MPIYEYECAACGHRFELLVGRARTDDPVCPVCGGAARKMMSAHGGIVMKGAAGEGGRCCGQAGGGCDSPKRCCEQ